MSASKMPAFGEIARRISSLPQCGVDIILSFASNALHRGQPLVTQTYVCYGIGGALFSFDGCAHAAASLTWLRATAQAFWRDEGIDTDGRVRLCELCGYGMHIVKAPVVLADIPLYRTHEVLPHCPLTRALIAAHRREVRYRVCDGCVVDLYASTIPR